MSQVTEAPFRKLSKERSALNIDDLASLFEADRIRSNASNQMLASWGGYDGLASALNVNPKRGISNEPARLKQRRRRFGCDTPIYKPLPSFLQFVKDTFCDEMVQLLCVSAVISLLLGILAEGLQNGWLQGFSILVAISLIVSVTSINNYLKERQFRRLNTLSKKKRVNVRRDGYVFGIDSTELLVGDVVRIETGEVMSCDGVLVECNGLVTDETSVTGDGGNVSKRIPVTFGRDEKADPWMVSGSKVVEGTGAMMVLAVGRNSQYGKLCAKMQTQVQLTPLQQKLQTLGIHIGHVGIAASLLTFLTMLAHLIWDITLSQGKLSYLSMTTFRLILQYFIVAVSIIVVAVPQGLPLAVTIALTYCVGKMKDDNNLVRSLEACEVMAGVTNICTDKTGTLTESNMQVIKIFANNRLYETRYDKEVPPEFKQSFSKNVCLNSNAYPAVDKFGRFDPMGSKTECALLECAFKFGFDFRKVRSKKGVEVSKFFPFSSQSKKMAVVYSEKGKIMVSVKGAPDSTIDLCTHYYSQNGSLKPIDQQFKHLYNKALNRFSSQSLRLLLIAEKQFRPLNSDDTLDSILHQLTFIGVAGIRDPLRPQIIDSIKHCKTAGVTVRMLTGDDQQTSVAIAKQAGILNKAWERGNEETKYAVMTGKEFRAFVGGVRADERGKEVVRNIANFQVLENQLRVLARSTPEDKYIMAVGLKQLNQVVAMTGDGTNDAPALKKSDIGFAMGITGTQVAKDAADIILLDDNFSSIVTAIKWGRNILESIRKFLQFQLTVNAVVLGLAFLGAVFTKETPLNPIQMLWVNLIMDTFAALALATQSPSQQLLSRRPYSRYQPLITPQMWKSILYQASFHLLILSVVLFLLPQLLGLPSCIGLRRIFWDDPQTLPQFDSCKHYTIFFNVFVLLQLFNEINCRKLHSHEANVFKGFFENWLFVFIFSASFYIHYKLMMVGGEGVKIVPLSYWEHVMCVGIGALSLVSGYVIRKLGPSGGIDIKLYIDSTPTIKRKNQR